MIQAIKDSCRDVNIYPYGKILYPPFTSLEVMCYNSRWTGHFHSHQCFQLIAVIAGKIMFCSSDHSQFHGKRGDVFIIPPSLSHSWDIEEVPCRTIQIYHTPLGLEHYGELSTLFGTQLKTIIKQSIQLEKICPVIDNLEHEIFEQSTVGGMLIHARLLELFALAAGHFRTPCARENRRMRVVSTILNYIEEHLREKIKIADLAKSACMSPSRLTHIFQECVGQSPLEYINTLRIERAKKVLMFSSKNISEVAAYFGFSSIHYFSRRFRKTTGLSPTDFVKKYSEK